MDMKKIKFVLPRVIKGNRGDIASRWGLLRSLQLMGFEEVAVFTHLPGDIPDLSYERRSIGKLRNLLPDKEGWKTLKHADVVLWAAGLDLQDDSSLAKLIYLWLIFHVYRLIGLRIWCLFQGAGPITTTLGKKLASAVLGCVDVFVARDPGTYQLVSSLSSKPRLYLGQDAIFLPGLELDLPDALSDMQKSKDRPLLIGINIRQWFHFSSNVLPYEFSKRKYRERSLDKMERLIEVFSELIMNLRQHYNARIILLSAYQPGVMPWEDDLPWLAMIKQKFADDPEVILPDEGLTIPQYFRQMRSLDLMIGMRLHSSLTALRFGVPAINVSYTLKGGDIYRHLGFDGNIVELKEVLQNPHTLFQGAARLIENLEDQRLLVKQKVTKAIDDNFALLASIIGESPRAE